MVFEFDTVPIIEKKIRERCVKSSLDTLLLLLFRRAEMSGYSALSCIYKNFSVLLSPGTLYPTLNELERDGLIKGRQEDRKKVYSLTPKGIETLSRYVAEYESFQSKVKLLSNDPTKNGRH